MLVLSRFMGEAIVIDHPEGQIRIVVDQVDRHGLKVRLAIDAPQSVVVDCEEISKRRKADETSTESAD